MRKKVPTEAQRISAAAQLGLLRHPSVDDLNETWIHCIISFIYRNHSVLNLRVREN